MVWGTNLKYFRMLSVRFTQRASFAIGNGENLLLEQ